MPRILARPLSVGLFKICPNCRRWFALQLENEQPDEVCRWIQIYRCKHCSKECEFASSHPPDAV